MSAWRRSSRCETHNCLEVQLRDGGAVVAVRDRFGDVIEVPRESWRALVRWVAG